MPHWQLNCRRSMQQLEINISCNDEGKNWWYFKTMSVISFEEVAACCVGFLNHSQIQSELIVYVLPFSYNLLNLNFWKFAFFPLPQLTINVLGWFVCLILYNQLDEIHALDNEAFKDHALSDRCENVANRKLQGALN